MKTANWWMLEMMARVSEDPVMTHGECLEKAIPEIQREAAEAMRTECASHVQDDSEAERILALPLPGDAVVKVATDGD